MKKVNNNLIQKTLGILIISALALIITLPGNAKACYGYCLNDGSVNNNNYNIGQQNSNQINPTPILTSITPNSANLVVGNMAVALIVTGANFVPGSLVEFNNTYRPTVFNSPNQLTVTFNGADLAVAGSYVISVLNPAPGGGTSNGVFFTVKAIVVPPPVQSAVETHTTTATVSKTASPAPKIAKTVKKSVPANTTGNSLTANTIFATDGFLPSNFIQWIIVSILVLLLILIGRKAYGSEKYKAKPLKHA